MNNDIKIEKFEKSPNRTHIRERSKKYDTNNYIDWYDDCGSGHSQLDYGHIFGIIRKFVGKSANKAYSYVLKKYKNKADYDYGYFTVREIFHRMRYNERYNFYKYYIDENNIIREKVKK